MPPREHGADEPFTGNILRLVRSIREPEAGLDVASESSVLGSFCAQERVKIFVGHEALEIKKPRVSPIGCQKHIGGTGTRLQSCWEQNTIYASQIRSANRELGANRNGCLRCPTLRISPIETVLHQSHSVPKSCSSNCGIGPLKMIRDDRDENGQVEIRMKPPCEVEITFVRKRGPCRRRNSWRARHNAPGVEVRTVGDESATGKQRWCGFGRSTLPIGDWNTKQS